jgi:integrase/recombinase XerD
MLQAPVVAIFVRHSVDCRYKDDEQWKRCTCRKHLRWTYDGRQYRQSARTRSWDEAEKAKRQIEDSYASGGKAPVQENNLKTIESCVESFIAAKQSQRVTAAVVGKYRRELGRLETFLASRGIMFPNQVRLDDLYAFRNTWDGIYSSTMTQQKAQERLRGFLRYLHDAGHIERVPRLSPIQVVEPPTMPLSETECQALVDAVPLEFRNTQQAQKARALIRLMRHSGLAIQDASTLERANIVHDPPKKLHRIVTNRQKTGTHVSVPIPEDLAQELLAVLNGNPRYVFWSGIGLKESSPKKWQRRFRKLRVKAGLPDFHPHQLRDTFAVDLLSKGVPLEEVSKLLGHESIKTTEKSYAKWVPERQDRLDSLVTATWAKRDSKQRPRRRTFQSTASGPLRM